MTGAPTKLGQKSDRMSVTRAHFTPSEVAEITGLSPEMQRVWRRRGQLPGGMRSPARFDATDAAELIVRYELSRYGVSPSESAALGRRAAPMVLCFALLDADGACEVVGPEPEVSGFLERFENGHRLAAGLAGAKTLAKYVWRADGDEVELVTDLQDAGMAGDFLSGFFVDLSRAGTRLAEVAGRPLITVEMESSEGRTIKRVRRLTRRRVKNDAAACHGVTNDG